MKSLAGLLLGVPVCPDFQFKETESVTEPSGGLENASFDDVSKCPSGGWKHHLGRAGLISVEVPPAVPVQLPPPGRRTGLLGLFAEQCCSQMVTPEIKAGGAARALGLTSKSKSIALL